MKVLVGVAALCLISSPASAQIMEMNGTWTLNAERTLGPSPKEETLIYKIKPGEQGYIADWTEADGRKGHAAWVAKYDGNDQPTAGAPGTTVSLQKLDGRTELVTNKRDGKVTSTYTRVLVDGGTTILSIGRDGNGKVTWVRVFEKQ
jgi:hypothetical protein